MGQESNILSEYNISFLEHLDEGVYFVDRNRQILYWNQAAEKITGYLKDEVVGICCWDNLLMHVDADGKNLCKFGCPVSATVNDKQVRSANVFLHHKEGHRVPISVRVLPLEDWEGKLVGAIEIFTDETNKASGSDKMRELAKLAFVDEETGFSNQNYLKMKLNALHHEMLNTHIPYGVVLLKITNNKQIVTALGQAAYIRAIKMAGKTIASLSKPDYLFGRWDELVFAVFIPNIRENILNIHQSKYKNVIEKSAIIENGSMIEVKISAISFVSQPNDDLPTMMNRIKENIVRI